MTIKTLILGDVIGAPGCRALFVGLKNLINKKQVDLVIANGENASGGRGIAPSDMEALFKSGVQVITSGNHIWQKKEIIPYLESEDRLLRPENYPKGVPGKGTCVIQVKGASVAVCNLEGRVHLSNIRCPFKVGEDTVRLLKGESRIIIIDFHAEFPQEKEALAWYLDGKISALVGTHSHVQTADERILPKGTAYITDIGMTGPVETCIGMSIETAIKRSLTQMPLKMEVEERQAEINGVLLTIDAETGYSKAIERIKEKSIL